MKTSKEDILMTSVRMFAERGFDAVSTSMIAGELGITKGALYRHFENKQAIFDSIIKKMFELDEERAREEGVPEKEYEEDKDAYKETELLNLSDFAVGQFDFWTTNEFAAAFRKMITLEQFKSAEMNKLYQDVIGIGPVKYTSDIFKEMIESGKLNEEARAMGEWKLALMFFAPLKLAIELADGGAEPEKLKADLRGIIDDFGKRWSA